MPLVIAEFDENENPFSVEKLNDILKALAGTINSLAGETLVQFSPTNPDDGTGYAQLAGATFLGQISAPSILIGPADGQKYDAVSMNDQATPAKLGIVKQAANVAQLAQAITSPPTQAEVEAIQTALNDLLTALVSAEQMASA